jgi:hypothetical protein
MTPARRVIIDVKTGQVTEETFDYTPPPPPEMPEPINLEKLRKLLDHAKKEGWVP